MPQYPILNHSTLGSIFISRVLKPDYDIPQNHNHDWDTNVHVNFLCASGFLWLEATIRVTSVTAIGRGWITPIIDPFTLKSNTFVLSLKGVLSSFSLLLLLPVSCLQ